MPGERLRLIEVAPEWRHLVNPSLDHWGGPTGLGDNQATLGEKALDAVTLL